VNFAIDYLEGTNGFSGMIPKLDEREMYEIPPSMKKGAVNKIKEAKSLIIPKQAK
jgi:hypothetical protein